MKACPDCGAELMDQEAVVCPACGKQLSDQHENEHPSEETVKGDAAPASPDGKMKRKWLRRKPTKEAPPIPEVMGEPVDDGYDGYYNDVLPPDLDRVKEGLDKELIKKIIVLGVAVFLIINFCVAMMYML